MGSNACALRVLAENCAKLTSTNVRRDPVKTELLAMTTSTPTLANAEAVSLVPIARSMMKIVLLHLA